MGARLEQLWSQLAAFFLAQPPARRMAVGAVGLVSMAAVLGLAWWAQRPLYRPLFTTLAERDASAIVEALKSEKVPFQLEDGGRAVLVPAERQYELRLALASRGLPEGGGVGFEIFDKQTLGQTDFLQRLNYQRALQGELGRTIGQLGGVEAARVHLALPARSLFVAEDRPASASGVERTEETYDPDRTAIRTQRTTREETIGAKTPGGPPGVQANLTNDPAAAAGPDGPKSERRDESQSYEVSKVVSRTVAPVGAVKQLSVAVLIDGTYTEGEGGKRTFNARPSEEIDRLRELVKSAVGFSESRGDKIEIASVPFQSEAPPAGEGAFGAVGRWAPAVLTRLLAVAFAAAMLLYVVRPVVLGVASRLPGPRGIGAMEGAVAQLTHENLALTQQHPERAAQLVREWLRAVAPPA